MSAGAEQRVGNHRASLHGTENERLALLAPCVRAGLDAGEKVICTENAHRVSELVPHLVRRGVDATGAAQSGRLRVLAAEVLFPPETQTSMVADALAAGYPAIRFATDGTSAAAALRPEEHCAGERGMERLARRLPVSVLCQYAAGALLEHALQTVVSMHPRGCDRARSRASGRRRPCRSQARSTGTMSSCSRPS